MNARALEEEQEQEERRAARSLSFVHLERTKDQVASSMAPAPGVSAPAQQARPMTRSLTARMARPLSATLRRTDSGSSQLSSASSAVDMWSASGQEEGLPEANLLEESEDLEEKTSGAGLYLNRGTLQQQNVTTGTSLSTEGGPNAGAGSSSREPVLGLCAATESESSCGSVTGGAAPTVVEQTRKMPSSPGNKAGTDTDNAALVLQGSDAVGEDGVRSKGDEHESLHRTSKVDDGAESDLLSAEQEEESFEPVSSPNWYLTFEEFVAGIQQEPGICQFFAEQYIIELNELTEKQNDLLDPYTRLVFKTALAKRKHSDQHQQHKES